MTTEAYNDYAAVYWAAACLVFWAGCGVSDVQMAEAVRYVCDDAKLTIPQKALLTRLLHSMQKGEEPNGHA